MDKHRRLSHPIDLRGMAIKVTTPAQPHRIGLAIRTNSRSRARSIVLTFNERSFTSDESHVPDFSFTIWTILCLIAFGGILAAFHLVTCLTRNETALHDLKRRVAVLQLEVAERAKDQREREMFIDEATPVAAAPLPASAAPAQGKAKPRVMAGTEGGH